MSDLRRGCIGAAVTLWLFMMIGTASGLSANYTLLNLQALAVMAIGFSCAVALFGKESA